MQTLSNEIYEKLLQENQDYNVYLYNNGKCVANKFVESDIVGVGNKGEVYASKFIENSVENGVFSFGEIFVAPKFSEIYKEIYYLLDKNSEQLTDENGNNLFMEIFEGYDIYYLIDRIGNQLTDENGNNLIIEMEG